MKCSIFSSHISKNLWGEHCSYPKESDMQKKIRVITFKICWHKRWKINLSSKNYMKISCTWSSRTEKRFLRFFFSSSKLRLKHWIIFLKEKLILSCFAWHTTDRIFYFVNESIGESKKKKKNIIEILIIFLCYKRKSAPRKDMKYTFSLFRLV